ncbi:hypothetical protein [Paenibacillus sp. Leaf72]|uniref:hypothetical protein n=1 Tax=Paenibacillus sp. Leaf72 TaxID=1736234 RepID=UPI0006FE4624|nr:hypothetical protein [Paenibacillus sp. Leaf72]KQN96836.1 hypothetical protein ASF12_22455 [Paenibacillus sp. Leaf72]
MQTLDQYQGQVVLLQRLLEDGIRFDTVYLIDYKTRESISGENMVGFVFIPTVTGIKVYWLCQAAGAQNSFYIDISQPRDLEICMKIVMEENEHDYLSGNKNHNDREQVKRILWEIAQDMINRLGTLYPLTLSQIKDRIGANNMIKGIIKVDFNQMLELNLDEFLDLISEKLIGSPLLMDVTYELIAVANVDSVWVKVSGDASFIMNSDTQEEVNEN